MKKLEMVDLKGQYEQIKDEVENSFQEVISSAAFINGPQVQEFQKELESYLGVRHVIPCANGTDALQIAMMGLGLQPGDEVITADFTFAATVEVIALLQLTPVLVDVDPDTFNIDPEAIKKAITPKTKAIVPVHLFGQTAAMDEILELATEHELFVIEDNAQAVGGHFHSREAKTLKTGVIGDIGATSFFPSKNLGCYGDGGALFTNDDGLAHRIRGIVNHGMYQRYHHDVVGVNSRLDSLQAVVLRAKLPRLDLYNEARKAAAEKYDQAFQGHPEIIPPFRRGDCDTHVYHQYTLKILNGKRDALAEHLQEKGIPFGVYYPIPLHQQKAYADPRYREEDFPVTNQLVKEVISLPMHTELDDEQISYISQTIIEFLSK